MAMMEVRISLWILIVSADSLSEVSSAGVPVGTANKTILTTQAEKSKYEHTGSTTGDFISTKTSPNTDSSTDPSTDPKSYLGTYLAIGGAVLAIVMILIIVIVIVRVFRKRKQKCTAHTVHTYDDPFDQVLDELDYHYYDQPEMTGSDNANLNRDEYVKPNQEREVTARCRKLPDSPKEVNPIYTEAN